MAARFLLSQAAHVIKPTVVVVPGAGLSWAHLHPILLALSSSGDFDIVRFSSNASASLPTLDAPFGPGITVDALTRSRAAVRPSIRQQAAMLANALDSLKPHLESGRDAIAALRRSHGMQDGSGAASAWSSGSSNPLYDAADPLSGGLLHFVTHGTGALVLRAALSCRDWNGVQSRVVMLAPPNRGSVAARRLWQQHQRLGRPLLQQLLGDSIAQELGEGDAAHFDAYGGMPASFRTWVVAGSGLLSPLQERLNIPGLRGGALIPPRYGPHDGLVAVADTACFSQTAYRVSAAAAEQRARTSMMQSLVAGDAAARRRVLSSDRRMTFSRTARGRSSAAARGSPASPQSGSQSGHAGEGDEAADSDAGDGRSAVAAQTGGRVFSPNIARSIVPAGHVSVCYAPSVVQAALAFLRSGQPGVHADAITGLPEP